MPDHNALLDPKVDIYETTTPYGPVRAIFDGDVEVPGVAFDPPDSVAAHYMREIISRATGPDGIGLSERTLLQDDYFGFCQPNGSGVTIEQPWYLREEAADEEVALDASAACDPSSVALAAARAATSPANALPEPTEAQKEAGNYPKGHVTLDGLDIAIENPAGSRRRPEWPPLTHTYGYFKGSLGRDKDHVDVFLGPEAEQPSQYYVVDQIDPKTGRFDEHKVMMGFASEDAARDAYLSNYEPGWAGLGAITAMTPDEFKVFIRDKKRTASPAASGRQVLDDANGGRFSILETLRAQLGETVGVLERLGIAREILAARESIIGETPADDANGDLGERTYTGHFFDFDPKRKTGHRKRDNAQAMALLAQIDAGEVDPKRLTDEQKATLAKYSGTGGALIGADGKKGSAYEYYTPKPIAEGVWTLLSELGFKGGKVLDPSAGTGIFGATAPVNAVVDAVELNETSGRVNALVNGGPGHQVTIAPFERVAAASPDEAYDAIVTNVPFGTTADRGANRLLDQRYQNETLETYFILRSLEKLRPGGLAAFIVPPRCVSGKLGAPESLRYRASLMAEFLGAYRLPNTVFATANADTITDVIIFRKHSREALEKIEELRQQNPDALREANVIWQPFIEGKYFDTEGKRFVLGEFKPKDPDKFRDVDRVINPASVQEIAAMLRRFDGSRIRWNLLNATETVPIVYQDGDTLTHGGETLEMRDGRWVVLARSEESERLATLLGQLASPYSAFENNVSLDDARLCMKTLVEHSRALDVPDWLRGTLKALSNVGSEAEAAYWRPSVIGQSVAQVIEERLATETGVNFLEEYPALSEAMRVVAHAAKNAPGSLGGKVREGLRLIGVHYQKKTGYSAVWRGDVLVDTETAELTPEQRIEGLKYRAKSSWIGIDEIRAELGNDFNPLTSPDWCVSSDGSKVCHADDYYVGNYQALLDRIDDDIRAAASDEIRDKLLTQKDAAAGRVKPIDADAMTFDLFSPLVPIESKAEFLRRFVHSGATVVFDDETGHPVLEIDIQGSKLTDREKLTKRITHYLNNGTITLGGAKLIMSDEQGLRELRRMVNTANEQFNAWVHGNPPLMESVRARANDPAKLRFEAVEDEAPLTIPGLHPEFKPHGYQNAFARRMGREFGGGNGFGVGLGKTFTALMSVQHVQNIGVKKKTVFVVPNSVLSNWRKEAITGAGTPGQPGFKPPAYASDEGCLFVGWRNGKVDSSKYDEDLTAILENRHSKIFMTYEAFERIRLRDDTITAYEQFMRRADRSFAESEDKKQDERNKGKQATLLAVLSEKTGSAPYLEDMGIDSLVIDEAHAYKNAAQTVDFTGAKFLSLAPASKRGIDAQAKSWYIRGGSELQDGVLLLTATPITNSPLEIYSMLTLAIGHDRLNDLCLGVKGADDFMNMVAHKENEDDVSIDGVARTIDVFTGLDNVSMLRKALGDTFVVKSAADVGATIVVPDRDELATPITLPSSTISRLELYKGAFRYAIDELTEKKPNRGSKAAYDAVAELFDEPMRLIGHPFNLINKMTLLIADPELDQRATFFTISDDQVDKAREVIAAFNKKKINEERGRPGPWTADDAVIGRKTARVTDDGDAVEVVKIRVEAKIDETSGRLVLDTLDPATIMAFEALAEKAGLHLDVTIPPKLAAMLENFQKEQATPRGVTRDGQRSTVVKQIIFCDILGLHPKIKRLLVQRAGVPASAIAILTGKINNKPEDILRVQDEFNANGEDNKLQVIIANEKAEVGINLQNGTQAIHHLTIGWTPDSLEQRNGRAARQGNLTEKVTIYHYDADGTFDSSKRTMVNKKADWISAVMDAQGGDSVKVTGGLTREQMEALIDVVGDADAMTRMQEAIAAKEAETRAAVNRDKQSINLDTIVKQRRFLKKYEQPDAMAIDKVIATIQAGIEARRLQARSDNLKTDGEIKTRAEQRAKAAQTRYDNLVGEIRASVKFMNSNGYGANRTFADVPFDEALKAVENNGINRRSGKFDLEEAQNILRGRKWPSYKVEVIEDSPIHQSWAFEVAMAQSMVDESVKTFKKRAEEEGAYPGAIADLFAQGAGALLGGTPLVANSLIEYQGHLGVMKKPEISDGAWTVEFLNSDTFNEKTVFYSHLNPEQTQMAYPGTSHYDTLVTRAAEIEDAAAEAGHVGLTPFSERIPEVATRRKVESLARYSLSGYKLPPPHFPYVMNAIHSTPVRDAIRAEQSAVVISIEGYQFTVKASLDVQMRTGYGASEIIIALAEYAKAKGMQLVGLDFARGEIPLTLDAVANMDGFEEALSGSNREEIEASAMEFIRSAAPWINFDGIPLSECLTYSRNHAVELKIREAELAAMPTSTGTEGEGGTDGDDWVAVVSGFGFRSVVDIRDFADKMGEPAAWITKTGKPRAFDIATARNLPGAPANSWVMRRRVYNALREAFPTACQTHNARVVR